MRSSQWTEQEIQVLKTQYSSMSNVQLADKLSRTINAIHSKASKLNLNKNKGNECIGMCFGRLTVLKQVDNGKYSHIRYECICECGKICIADKSALKNGRMTSCGCSRRKVRKSLIGKKFGTLTVVERVMHNASYRQTRYRCECECGRETVTSYPNLVSGHIVSCGNCIEPVSLGERFGKLVVTELIPAKSVGYYIKAKCDCGDVWEGKACNLTLGKVESCGCTKSRGEYQIKQWLLENNIVFEQEKTFDGCKNKHKLRFDFFIPQYGCVEFQGEQHYKPSTFGSGVSKKQAKENLVKRQHRDKIKKQYCQENNVKLLEIIYTDVDKIEDILTKELL